MNQYRRGILRKCSTRLTDVDNEITLLSTDEAVGEKESIEKRDHRVRGWIGVLVDIVNEIDWIAEEEEDAANSTRGEDLKASREQATSELQECSRDLTELTELDDLGLFNEMWSSKYDSMINNLETAINAE